MNIFNLISEIEKVDPEIYDRLDSRRSVFRNLTGFGKKLSAAALPLAFGSILNKAYGQIPTGTGIAEVLNFALSLEYLEMYFYQQGQAASGLQGGLSENNRKALNLIAVDERNHVNFLRTAISGAGLTPVADPTAAAFDFTGGKGSNAGPLATVFTDPAIYLAVAQSLEDTGVRAYKGGATVLMTNDTFLTAALNIHSVEARHASQLRAMRRAGANNDTPSQGVPAAPYGAAPKSWISGQDGGGPAPAITAPIYGAGNNGGAPTGVDFPAEDNITQAGTPLTSLPNTTGFPASAFSEAFDEALDVTTVKTIARTFVVNGNNFLA